LNLIVYVQKMDTSHQHVREEDAL